VKKVLVITGASRGIGAATARLAAQRGYAVCVNYRRDASAAQAVVLQIRSSGGDAMTVAADIAIESDVVRMFEAVDKTFGPLTALVNNAGTVEKQIRVEHMDAVRLQHTFAVNVMGSFLCSREAIRRMSTRLGGDRGAIVNVSSMAAQLGGAGEYVDYAAAKAAIDTMTVGLAKEVASEGIRVNAVRPGLIYTDFHGAAGDPHRVDRMKDAVPMKRGGEPEEVARAILWLLSDEASYCTGTILDVSGGR
jgi:NAD(P)-dependent dehydrogenase (short-subunit alcohol dehydrogenase family)